MKQESNIIITLFIVSFVFFNFNCDKTDNHERRAPAVTPYLSSVGRDTATIIWNNVGKYTYGLSIIEDSTESTDFRGINFVTVRLTDTFYTFTKLKPVCFYKVKILTIPDSGTGLSIEESWPLLTFKTKQ